MSIGIVVTAAIRVLLVLLFLPFSALDKILNPKAALTQAQQAVSSAVSAKVLILLGLFVEIFMSIGVVSGYVDRMAALILAGYCVITALLWKQFWRGDDFWVRGESRARGLFWDFWKNIAVAGGFLLITFGTTAGSVHLFLEAPFSSTHPYALLQDLVP